MDLYVSGLGGKYVKNLEENKKVSSQDGYIIIHKETMINYFFTGVLVLAFGVFIAMLITGIINMKIQDENAIDTSIIAYNQDDLLNITYPVPGGSWTFVDVDTTELSETVAASMGEDKYFSIDDDVLTEEVMSYLGVNQGVTGFREFMSFTFMPDVEYNGDEFVAFCESVFEKNIQESGSYESYELYDTQQDKYMGVMMKMRVNQKVDGETEGTTEEKETYYTQYVKRIGKNIGVITYGSLIEDNTVDKYLQYFLNNIRTEKSLIE